MCLDFQRLFQAQEYFLKKNELELAKLIQEILSDSNIDLYNEISNKCKIRAQLFDINKMVNESFTMYNNLIYN